jgi:Na+-transporting NADH:ubiquinone oxidoreductase subunit B
VGIGAVILVYSRIVNWRILSGIAAGVFSACFLISFFLRPSSPPIFELPWLWHFGIGGLAFFSVFIATDPATTPHSDEGKWVYGIGIGALTVLIRCLSVDIPEGVMLSILIMMLFSPLIDFVMIYFRLKKRIPNEL